MRSAALVVVLLGLVVGAAAAEETGRQIYDRAKALDDGPRWWNDREQRVNLEVDVGASAPMRLELRTFDRKEHGRKQQSLIVFLAPAEKAGIALLGHTVGGAPARQWLYTPETKRVREVAKDGKLRRFDVTDFTYHDLDVLTDLLNWTEEEAEATLKGSATIDNVPCHVIELEPHLKHVIYPRVLIWLGKDDLVARQVEFYITAAPGIFSWGHSDPPIRRYRQSDIRMVGAIPVAHRIEVETPAEDSRTIIQVEEVRFDQGLAAAFFDSGRLEMHGK
jgi:Outer membrane lipoprotein-sorting protein